MSIEVSCSFFAKFKSMHVFCQPWERGILQEGRNNAIFLKMLSRLLGDAKLESIPVYYQLLRNEFKIYKHCSTEKSGGHHPNIFIYFSSMSQVKVYCSQLCLIIYTGGDNSNLIVLDNYLLSQYSEKWLWRVSIIRSIKDKFNSDVSLTGMEVRIIMSKIIILCLISITFQGCSTFGDMMLCII